MKDLEYYTTKELKEELKDRGEDKITDLKRHLCDIVECGYHTSEEEILKLLKEQII